MEFIIVEQFKEQPKEVQNVFLDWWKPSVGDIFHFATVSFNNDDSTIGVIGSKRQIKIAEYGKGEYRIPLFTEGQLRKFIEDKANCKVMIEYTSCENIVIKICTQDEVTGSLRYNRKLTFPNNKFDLINSYWKVACKIAKEEVDG